MIIQAMNPSHHEAELRIRIEEISVAINLQMKILKDLHNQKCDLQRDLNAIRDPVARMPFELASKIFLLCVAANPAPRVDAAPMTLFNVSRIWRNIALGTPALWASVRIGRPHRNFGRLVETWIPRSQSRLLSLFFRDSWDDKWAKRFIKQCAHRVETLDMVVSTARQLKRIMAPFTPDQPPAFYSLTRLAVRYPEGNLRHCIQILRAASHLVECRFLDFEDCEEDAVLEGQPLTLTHLESLRLGTVHPDDYCTSRLLLNLTLPVLKKLVISFLDIPLAAFISFLTRSAPPLQFFHDGSSWALAPTSQRAEAYRQLNDLEDLSVCLDETSEHPPSVFRFLAADADFLPSLRTVTISGDPRPSAWHFILPALRARRNCVKSFRLKFHDVDELPSDVFEALREIAQDGMRVHGVAFD